MTEIETSSGWTSVERRDVMRAAGVAMVAGVGAAALIASSSASAQTEPARGPRGRDDGPFGRPL